MKVKTLICFGSAIILFCVGVLLGFVYGYFVVGLSYANDMEVRVHSHVLMINSLAINKLSDSADINSLAEAVQLNANSLASFISNWEPYSQPATKKRIEETLEAWREAERKLNKLASSKKELAN